MHLYKRGRLDFYGSLSRFPFFNLKSEKSIEFSISTYSNSELLRKIKRDEFTWKCIENLKPDTDEKDLLKLTAVIFKITFIKIDF